MTDTSASQDDLALKQKAIRQVEFYFADSNLPYDRFMWALYAKDPEHWLPLATIASFKRMRDFTSKGTDWLVDALKTSKSLEVDPSGEKIRRTTEPKEPVSADERSVYAKGFGDEDGSLQTKLEAFFQNYGMTNAVRMRRDQNQKFKSSVFVEFTEPAAVDAFLKADPKPSWEGTELVIMTKEEYCDMKIKEKGLSGRAADLRRDTMAHRKFNAFRLSDKEKAAFAKGETAKSDSAQLELYLDFLGAKLKIVKDEEGFGTVEESEIPFTPGATLKFDGAGPGYAWSEIKIPIKDLFAGKAPYIQAEKEASSGLVGFSAVLSDEDVEKVKKGVKTLGGQEVTWSKPAEDAEKQFQIDRAKAAAKAIYKNAHEGQGNNKPSTSRGRGGGRGGRGGRGGGGRGRGRGGGRGGARQGDSAKTAEAANGGEQSGEKRKRAVEPDGGPHTGVRGTDGPPALQTAKKAKTDS